MRTREHYRQLCCKQSSCQQRGVCSPALPRTQAALWASPCWAWPPCSLPGSLLPPRYAKHLCTRPIQQALRCHSHLHLQRLPQSTAQSPAKGCARGSQLSTALESPSLGPVLPRSSYISSLRLQFCASASANFFAPWAPMEFF